ncbi:MAG: tetratricopeptide repeat protein [Bacteroidales bacterium]|nr:tetratricopeptide repeat protein [Bacteroidales bacterium]
MKRIALTILLIALSAYGLSAQEDRSEVRAGNRKFKKGDYSLAEIDYRKALVKDSLSYAANYDLASALYRREDYQNASQTLASVSQAGKQDADYHFNMGDIALQQKDYAAALESFKQSLLLNPADLDAKENYIYAKKMLENEQNQGGGGDGQNQDNQDNQDQNQDQDNQDQNQNNDDQSQDQQSPDPRNISPQQAAAMLQAIQAKEAQTQEKVKKEKAAQLKSKQKEQNW